MGKGVRRKHKVSIFVLFQIDYEQEDIQGAFSSHRMSA